MTEDDRESKYEVVLFYRYVFIDDHSTLRKWLAARCTALGLLGRVLVAKEGINGTLAGIDGGVCRFIDEMIKDRRFKDVDWKVSSGAGKLPFSDLHVKHVKEIISTGEMRTFIEKHISFDEHTFGGISGTGIHLTPEAFHEAILRDDGVVIDVRNDFEYAIGHFRRATGLNTNTYSESWKALDDIIERELQDNPDVVNKKNIYMYCTGGVRCEKASAYMRARGFERVYQLQGGIHKYFEAYAGREDCQFIGKEFVFDGRVAMCAAKDHADQLKTSETHPSFKFLVDPTTACTTSSDSSCSDRNVVGRCFDCLESHDIFSGLIVCTVCRMPVLCCPSCVDSNPYPGEYYCKRHRYLKGIYFTILDRFNMADLRFQLKSLVELEVGLAGKREKNRRRTLRRQREKIHILLQHLESLHSAATTEEASEVNSSAVTSFSDERSSELLKNPKAHVGKGFFWQS